MMFESRFLQNLQQRISEDLTRLHTELGSGSSIVADDAAATGMKCVKAMGTIAGLKAALEHIQQINDEMSGKGEKKQRET